MCSQVDTCDGRAVEYWMCSDIILYFYRQALFNIDYKVDSEYGRGRQIVNFIKERYQHNGRPFEFVMDKYPNLYAAALIDELCTNIGVQCACKYYSFLLHLVSSTLDQGLPSTMEKTILFYFMTRSIAMIWVIMTLLLHELFCNQIFESPILDS